MIPLFPLELVLLPGAPLPLHIFEPRYKEMIAEVMSQNDQFGLVRLLNNNSIAEVGCTAEVLEVTKKYDDGRMDIVTQGQKRFEIARLDQERAFLRAEVTFFEDDPGAAAKAELDKLIDLHKELVGVSGGEVARGRTGTTRDSRFSWPKPAARFCWTSSRRCWVCGRKSNA